MGVVEGVSLDFIHGRSRQLLLELFLKEQLLLVQAEVPSLGILHHLPEVVHLISVYLAKDNCLLGFINHCLPSRCSLPLLQVLVESVHILLCIILIVRELVRLDKLLRLPY